jgi:pimeloyl-ACP methyl ester carboxylesterase
MGDEMKELQRAEDGVAFEDGVLTLRDGRDLAWRWYGEPGDAPVLMLQGMPGSRVSRSPDPSIQRDLHVRYLQADRPGYGGSTRKPGHGIADLADDLVQLLDAHHVQRVPVIGGSAGGPQALALAARHPDRVSAVTVVVGAAPLRPEEAAGLVEINARGYLLKQQGWDALYRSLVAERERMLSEEGLDAVFRGAPPEDLDVIRRLDIRRLMRISIAEALRQGAEGWADESYALRGDWDFDPARISASVTWWHGDDDRNAPLSAALRAAARIPHVDFRVWQGEGHAAATVHEREVMEELLGRSR